MIALTARLQRVIDTKQGLKGRDLQLAVDIVDAAAECFKAYGWRPAPASALGQLAQLISEASTIEEVPPA